MSGRLRLILIASLLLTSLSGSRLFSQAAVINGWRNANHVYCSTEANDTLTGASPSGKDFYIDGAIYTPFSAKLTKLANGVAIFKPSAAGVGPHTIVYGTIGSHDVTVIINVVVPPAISLAPFANVCQNQPAFSLFNSDSSNVSPKTGTFSGPGVDAFGKFDPAIAGAGVKTINYSVTTGGCVSSASATITVLALPVVSISPFSPACEGAGAITLTQGTPAGGVYSGAGVSGNTFNPLLTGPGNFPIQYTFTNGTCSGTAVRNIVVSPKPVASFSGLAVQYCGNSASVTLTGTPAGATSRFSGSGITDNMNGTAVFNPATSGLGLHTIRYIYVNGNGCSDTATQNVQTGTNVVLSGLATGYCINSAPVTIAGSPLGGTFTVIPGLTDNGNGTAVFNPSVAGAGSFIITYQYNDAFGCLNSISQTVTVYTLPVLSITNMSPQYCAGMPGVTISGNYKPAGIFTGASVTDNGNGTAVFNPSALSPGGPYNVTYTYLDATSNCQSSLTRQVLINPLPTATLSGDISSCKGTAVPLLFNLGGTPPFSLSYTDGSGTYTATNIPGLAHSVNVVPTDTSIYSLIGVTDAKGCFTAGTGTATINVIPPVSLVTQPLSQTVCLGSNVIFSILASGANLQYQWQKNGIIIPGATSRFLVFNNAALTDAGIYRCVVSGDCGPSLTSNDATLSFYSTTTLVLNPVSAHECEGENISFVTSANGSNLTYQWYKDGIALVDNLTYGGTKTSSLSITSLLAANSGSYHCVITGTCGTVSSLPATLLVDRTIAIVSQPAPVVSCVGNNISFSIVATGDLLSYQWQKENIDIPGATGTTLALNNITFPDAGFYRCHIKSPCGSELYSIPARLTLSTAVTISSNPVNLVRCEGDNATFTVATVGTGISYQWKKNGAILVDNGHISGSQTASLTINNATAADDANYQCQISGICNTLNSVPATLSVDSVMVITAQPKNVQACLHNNLFFTIGVTGNNISYQWLKNGTVMPGKTSGTLVINDVSAADEAIYTCEITNTCGRKSTSDPAAFSIYNPVVITVQPANQDACTGDNIILTAMATGSGIQYQWEKDGIAMADGGNVGGTKTGNLVITGLTHANEGIYNCLVTGSCGVERSIPASVTTHDQVIIIKQPAGDTVCAGFNTSFIVVATGATGYQWQKDLVNLPGENGPQLIINNVNATDSGVYRCVVSSTCGTLATDGATLLVKTFPSFTLQPASASICEKQAIILNAAVTGSNLTYRWIKNGVFMADIPGITGTSSAMLKIDSAKITDTGIYTLKIQGYCGTLNSSNTNIAITALPAVTLQPQPMILCEGQTAGFSLSVNGIVTYQWQKDNVNIPGETSSSLVINNVNASNQGIYRCVVTGSCGTFNSQGALLTVNATTRLTQQPADITTCEGNTVMTSISATGTLLSYQWKYNGTDVIDGAGISGSKVNSLSINPTLPAHSGIYQCQVTGTCGTALSNSTQIVINEKVRFTSQPVSADVCSGQKVNLHAGATGTAITYQWQKNGTDIPGAQQPDFTINAVTMQDTGMYRCVISGACGSLSSETVQVRINSVITLNSQPQASIITCLGNSVVIATSATGTNLIYQWYLNGVALSDNAGRQGTATPVLTIHSVVKADEGIYLCRIINTCSSVSTSGSLLTVNIPASIIEQPAGINSCAGSNATFTINASGTGITWQWQKGTSNLPGANSPVYNILNITSADTGLYRCLVISACDTLESNPARLTVSNSIAITSQPPAMQSLCEGSDVVMGISATGTVLSYQWKKNGINLTNNASVSGAQTSTLKITGISAADDGAYTCLVSGTCNTLTSNISQLDVQLLPVIVFHPADYSVLSGGNASFKVSATGDALSCQWYFNGILLSDGAGISGSATSDLIISNAGLAQQGVYHAVITGTCGIAASNPAALILLSASIITTQPSGDTKCEGESITISLTATGSGNVYQWMKNGINLINDARISGAQQNSLTINSLVPADAGSYNCIVNHIENSIPARLNVNRTTRIISSSLGENLCKGDAFTFVTVASGDSLDYAWYKDGFPVVDGASITGSATPVMSLNPVDIIHTGTYYCQVTGACGSATTNPADISISEPVAISKQPAGNTVCEGQTLNLDVIAAGNGISYQWFKNGSALVNRPGLTGATGPALVISNANLTDEGAYTCRITGTCSTINSTGAYITVLPTPVITAEPIDVTVCRNTMAAFVISTNLPNVKYQWLKNGANLSDGPVISGSATRTLLIAQATVADNGFYSCTVSADCDTLSSHPALLVVYDEPVITTDPASAVICEGISHVFNISATGSNLTYQWKKDGEIIHDGVHFIGTSTSSLQVDAATVAEAGIYTCMVSGSCHFAETTPATLTIQNTAVITGQPVIPDLCAGDDFALVLGTIGTGLTYQWEKDNVLLADGPGITGSVTNALTLNLVSPATEGIYECKVQGVCNLVSSIPVDIKITEKPAILIQPVGQSLCEGNNALFQVKATGENLIYQWKKDGIAITDNASVKGSATADLDLLMISPSLEGIYTCEISNSCATVVSNPASLVIFRKGIISQQPVSISRCPGDMASLSVIASGSGLSYQWEFNGSGISDGGKISGTNSGVLTIVNLDAAHTGVYRCVIRDTCGNVTNSDAVNLTVNKTLVISPVPAGDTLCEGSSLTLPVTAIGSNLVYQWFKNGTALTDGAGISGSQTSSLILNNLTISQTGTYFCSIGSSCGSHVTASIPVVVNKPTVITGQPANMARCTGNMALFSMSATGDFLSYQWQKDGMPLTDNGRINGSKSSLLVINNLLVADAGSYQCVVTGTCGQMNTSAAMLTVTDFPAAALSITGPTQVCQGTSGITLTVPDIAGADSYQWTLPPGIQVISGQNTRQLEVIFALHELGGPVYVAGINSCGAGTASPVLNISANPLPAVYGGENANICSDSILLSATSAVSPASGVWQAINGPAIIENPGLSQTRVNNLRMGMNQFTWTVTLNGCTNTDTITVNNNRMIMEAGPDLAICDHIYTMQAQSPANGTGEWSIVSGSGFNIGRYNPNTIVSGLSFGKNVFKWSVNYNGCVSYDTVVITNNMPSNAEAGPDQMLHKDNTNLNGNNPSVGTGEWSLLNGSAILENTAKCNTLVTGLGKGKNIFAWSISFAGCISTDTVVVENVLADSTDAGPNQILCSSTVHLNAKRPFPGYGEWSVRRGAANFANNSLYNTIAYNLAQGENVLVWTAYLNGITSDSVVIINDLPTTANAGVNFSLCADSGSLNANLPYIGQGEWTIVSGAGTFENPASNLTRIRNLGRGNNNLKWTIKNGTCTSSSIVTVINNTPTFADAGFDIITCEDTVVLKPNVPTFGTGEWSVVSGSARFRGNETRDLARDDNALVYTIKNAGCYSRDTLIVTSHKPSQARAGADMSVCMDSAILVANLPATGQGCWTLQEGSAQIEDLNNASSPVKSLGSGDNLFRWTITNKGCSSFDEMVISNDFIPAIAGADKTLCANETTLEANDPGYATGTWTLIGGTVASISNSHVPNSAVLNLAYGTNTLRWTVTKNTCSSYDEVSIVNNLPTPSFAGEDMFLCDNKTTLMAGSVLQGQGTWTVLNGAGVFSDLHNSNTAVTGLESGSNIFRWTTEKAGCISTDEVIINNNQPVNIYAGLDQTLCDDSTAMYAGMPVNGIGSWSVISGSSTFVDDKLYNTTVTNLANGQNRLKWLVANTGCSESDTVVITNNLPTRAIAGSDFSVCNSQGGLNANTPLFGTGEWSLINGSGAIGNTLSSQTLITDLSLGNNTLRWTITNQNCTSVDEMIIVNNSPTVALAGPDFETCGPSAVLFANSPLVGSGHWQVISGMAEIADSLGYNTTVDQLSFGSNTLRWTTENGSCLTFDDIVITNNLAFVNAGNDNSVYEENTVLSGNNPEMGTGQWMLIAGGGAIGTPSSYTTAINALTPGLNTFEWTITNGACTAHDAVTINFKIMPKVAFFPDVIKGCPSLTVSFVNATQYGTTYFWDLGDGSTSANVNVSHTYNVSGNFNVKLTAFGPDNRNITRDTIITVHRPPVADFQFAPDTAFINRPLRCYNYSFGASTYTWDFGDNSQSTEASPMHEYETGGEFNITLIASSDNQCSDTITYSVFVSEDGKLIFPNAFTPNLDGPGDGTYADNDRSNDVFHPYAEGIAEYSLEIFSRWGVLLFESKDVNIGWDGYYKGKLMSKEVYVWRAKGKFISGSEFVKTGSVLLIK